MADLHEFESRLAVLLEEAGCSKYSVQDLLRDTKHCRDGICADSVAHGESAADPFFFFIAVEGAAVFTFFESDFSVYVFRCDEHELVSQTDSLALADTDACKSLLARECGKTEPDVTIARGLAEYWFSS